MKYRNGDDANAPVAPITNTSAARGNNGNAWSGAMSGRAINTTFGLPASSCSCTTRCASARATPGSSKARLGSSAGSVTTSPAPSDDAART